MKKILKLSLAAICLATIASSSFAAKPGSYVGVGLGASEIEKPKGMSSNESKNLAGRLFAGYNFNEYFGLEAGLARYGKTTNKFTGRLNDPYNSATYFARNGEFNTTLTSFDVVAKGYIPIQDSGFNLYGLAGVAYVHTAAEVKAAGYILDKQLKIGNRNYNNNSAHPIYGVGVAYNVPQSNVTTNLELTRLQGSTKLFGDNKTANANMLTFNIAYNFD